MKRTRQSEYRPSCTSRCAYLSAQRAQRHGKALVFVVLTLPAVFGILGLIFDGGLLVSDSRSLQHVADAAATAAAMEIRLGKGANVAIATANTYVADQNNYPDAAVAVNIPPTTGPFAGNANYVEVILNEQYRSRWIHLLGSDRQQNISARAVAGIEDSTTDTALMVLDPNPNQLAIGSLPPLLPSTLALLGGLEVEGLGAINVDGAVLVNSEWGGVDEDGNPAGRDAGPPYAVSSTPLVALSRLNARDIRVTGGVDTPSNYGHFEEGEASPLVANQSPVPDPYATLPVPTVAADSSNVVDEEHGGVRVIALPLIGEKVLEPGVYDWIEVVTGRAVFEPGIYIIRGKNPLTQLSLNFLGGEVVAEGVMFYITNSSAYSPTSGTPDSGDGESEPSGGLSGLTPSVVINLAVFGGSFSPLNDPSSPFHGMLLYQRRLDPRPIVLVQENLIGNASLAGIIYSKWGNVSIAGRGTLELAIAAGSIRLVGIAGLTVAPQVYLPPAQDVFLVE